ncbi:MAG: dipeptide/oligopeptide/nickel ABC transporter permease/ATP-binding protein [Streptosporangiaceae bacterium]
MSFWRRLRRKPLGVAGLVVVTVVVAAAVFAPWVAPYGPNQADLLRPLAGPSAQHWLGTDALGRDTLSRLIWGARPTLAYTLEAVAVTIAVGVPLGLISGYRGGWTDRVIMWLADLGLSVPTLVVLLIVLSVFASEFWVALIFLGLFTAPPLIRFIRSATISVRGEPFIDAALVAGRSHWYIIRRHVVPRIRGTVLVQLTLLSAGGVVMLAGLGYLGYGPQPPNPTWGNMISDAQDVLDRSPWPLIAAGVVTALTVLSLGLLGDAVRDATVEAWTGEVPAPPRRPRGAARQSNRRYEPISKRRTAGPLVTVRGLTVAFQRGAGRTVVVDDVSFDIAAGEAVALVGESGCGKTSVARALLRLLASGGTVTAGSVTFDGQDVLALSGAALRRFRGSAIGYIGQEPMSALDPSFRVGAQLAEAVRAHEKLTGDRVRELLELVGLPDPDRVARLYPHELSGGMAQRVCIARALAGRPRLLIADEPTTALDVTVQAGILALLRDLRERTGMAILLVSHDWAVVAQVCDRTIVMYAGQVAETAPLTDLVHSPAHPYTEALLACRLDAVPAGAGLLPVIPGTVPSPEDWPDGCRFAARCGYATTDCRASAIPLEPTGDQRESRCLLAGRGSRVRH